jgi:predicted alpha/beta hydrolase family esterase
MQSSELKARAEAYARMAQKAASLAAKQRLLAQQQKCMAMARVAERQELAALATAPAATERQSSAPAGVTAHQERQKALAARLARAASRPAPSPAIKASPTLMRLWEEGVLSTEELDRRAQDVERLRQRFSAIPSHAARAAVDPDYWNRLYDSLVTL